MSTIRKYRNHRLQTNTWHHEEEPQQSQDIRKTIDKQQQLSHPRQDDCKTRKDTKLCITQQGPNTKPPQSMGGTLNTESTTTEPQPQNGETSICTIQKVLSEGVQLWQRFFWWWGEEGSKYNYKQAIFLMALLWRADDGPTLNAGLVALWFLRGSGPVLLRNPYIFVSFQGGGVGPPVSLRIRPWSKPSKGPIRPEENTMNITWPRF